MRWRRVQELFIPRRASVQTWMMLTFAVFVGLAVVGVGLYSYFVLQGQVREAARTTLVQHAERLAVQFEAEQSPRDMLRIGAQVAVVTDLDVTVARVVDGVPRVLGSWGPNSATPAFGAREETREALTTDDGAGFAERPGADGERRLFVTLYRPASGMLLRLGEPFPPLLKAVEQVQAVLTFGMVTALLLALLGAWIAARQVVGPLRAISRSAQRINEGDLDRSIRVRTRATEFQELTRSLNRMAGRFRSDISELQRMQRVQNEFIGNVSHEVKNPIFAVFGYLEALSSDTLPAAQRTKFAQKGLDNLQRLNNLFSDLIEIAKLEYREDLIHPEPFDLQGLIEEVGDMLQSRADEKALELDVENPSLTVVADRNRIRQVITNFVDNAIAYSDEGSVRVRMRRHLDKARVEVVDTGRGIPDEHLDRIFERFYRVDNARSRKAGGTGLGLAIVKQILEAHGATPHVESTRGRGTRFWFELPLADGDSGSQAAAEPAAQTAAA